MIFVKCLIVTSTITFCTKEFLSKIFDIASVTL